VQATNVFTPLQLNEFERAPDFKKMTCLLMTSMFSAEEMVKCSVTGKKVGSDEPRPALPQNKVALIIGLLYKFNNKCPCSENSLFNFVLKDIYGVLSERFWPPNYVFFSKPTKRGV